MQRYLIEEEKRKDDLISSLEQEREENNKIRVRSCLCTLRAQTRYNDTSWCVWRTNELCSVLSMPTLLQIRKLQKRQVITSYQVLESGF